MEAAAGAEEVLQRRNEQLEADLLRSGEYGQLLLKRLEQLEGENERLKEEHAAAEATVQAVPSEVLERGPEVERLRRRAERLEEENRRLLEQVDAGASFGGVSSFGGRTARADTEEPGHAEEAPSNALRGRSRSDHRLSDVLRHNEDLAEQVGKMERDGRALREENEQLQRALALDAEKKAEQQATEEKERMHTEQKARHLDIMHRVVDKIKAERLRRPDAKDLEIERLQGVTERLQQEGALAQEEACLLKEQLASARAECKESRSLIAQTQELLEERETEADALRGQIRQLQTALEAESYLQKDRGDASHSLAAEMARGEAEELGVGPTLSQARSPEALPKRRAPGGMDQPLLLGVADPLRGSPTARRSTAAPPEAAAAGLREAPSPGGLSPAAARRETAEAAEDLPRALVSLRERNLELTDECERFRVHASDALRWERRWLLIAVVMLSLLLLSLVHQHWRGCSGCP